MLRRAVILLGAVVALSVHCPVARAQEITDVVLARQLGAPSQALELKAGTGYTQGSGMLSPGRTMADASGAGLGVSAGIDFRLVRPWSLGVEARYQEYAERGNTAARGFAADLGATHHVAPLLPADPWVRLGMGYRGFFEDEPAGATGVRVAHHAFEVATATAGYDVRLTEDVAISPVIGADVDVFVREEPSSGQPSTPPLSQVAAFVYLGLQGRFDIGGARAGVDILER